MKRRLSLEWAQLINSYGGVLESDAPVGVSAPLQAIRISVKILSQMVIVPRRRRMSQIHLSVTPTLRKIRATAGSVVSGKIRPKMFMGV